MHSSLLVSIQRDNLHDTNLIQDGREPHVSFNTRFNLVSEGLLSDKACRLHFTQRPAIDGSSLEEQSPFFLWK